MHVLSRDCHWSMDASTVVQCIDVKNVPEKNKKTLINVTKNKKKNVCKR